MAPPEMLVPREQDQHYSPLTMSGSIGKRLGLDSDRCPMSGARLVDPVHPHPDRLPLSGHMTAIRKMGDPVLRRQEPCRAESSWRTVPAVILAYATTNEGWDVGTAILRDGLAAARYDSRDGYDWHPKERKYHRIDAKNGRINCTKYPKSGQRKTTPDKKGAYHANCDAARRAGAAPVYRRDPGYGPHLDRDGDGVACEY